jgi:hypothetical protein
MKIYELNYEKKARVWLNEISMPRSESGGNSKIIKKVSCIGEKIALREAVSVELLVPLGGRFLYGMLGGSGMGIGACETTLKVSNGLIAEKNDKVVDPLSGRLDHVTPWVSIDYCSSILDGAGLAAEKYASFFSAFSFDVGRQGVVGSSPNFFRLLGFLVVSLLAVPEQDIEDFLNGVNLDIGLEP